LGILFDAVIIPTAVHTEVFGTSIHCRPILPGFIQLTPVSQASSIRFLQLNLHAGESEAIALALEHGIERIILDDKQTRETANRLGLIVEAFGIWGQACFMALIPNIFRGTGWTLLSWSTS
jgi:predicted nucleic acid-binding protein